MRVLQVQDREPKGPKYRTVRYLLCLYWESKLWFWISEAMYLGAWTPRGMPGCSTLFPCREHAAQPTNHTSHWPRRARFKCLVAETPAKRAMSNARGGSCCSCQRREAFCRLFTKVRLSGSCVPKGPSTQHLSWYQQPSGVWFLKPVTSNIGYLDPLRVCFSDCFRLDFSDAAARPNCSPCSSR